MDGFKELYTEYYPRVYAFLFRMCRDVQLCEDMTQDTFFEAYKSLYRYDGTCKMFTFLAAIAKNVFYKYLRKKKLEYIDIDLLCETESPDDSPESVCMKRIDSAEVRRTVERLPQKYRDVVMLRTYADLSFADVAVSVGITENSAKVIFHRAKKILREELGNDYRM